MTIYYTPPRYPWTALKQKFITNSLLLDYGMRLVISLQIYNRIEEHQVICFLRNPRKKLKLIDMACSNAYNAKGEDVSPGNASQVNANLMIDDEAIDDEATYDEAANISGKGQIPRIKPTKNSNIYPYKYIKLKTKKTKKIKKTNKTKKPNKPKKTTSRKLAITRKHANKK